LLDDVSASIRARMASLPPNTRAAWQWDLATGFFAGIYQGCIWTFVARVARADLHASDRQMGWIAAAPALGYVFATVWARQMDGRSKLPFVYWTWLFSRGVFLLAPLMRTREQFVVLVCLTPFVFSISTPAYTAIMKEIYPDKQRGRLMSAVRMVMSMMTLTAALATGYLLDHGLDWWNAFLIGGMCGAASAFTFSRIPVPPTDALEGPKLSTRGFIADTVSILKRNPGYRWFSASVFVSGFGNIVATTLYPIYQVDRFHVSNAQVAHLQIVMMLATTVGYVFWGRYLDRHGPLATVLFALSINLTSPLLYASANNLFPIYAASAGMGLAMSGVDLAYLNTTLLFAEPGRASQYQALHSSFFGVRGSIAPHCAIPLMLAFGPRPAFMVSFVIIVFGVGLQLISMRDYRRQIALERRSVVAASKP
jgi:MFS transporter, DHA1 family, staphyloferrin B biosynthesis exporter